MYILLDVQKMAEDLAQEEFDEEGIYNAYIVMNEERKLTPFWQEIFDQKVRKHRDNLIYYYGKSEEESGADCGEHTGESDGV